MRMTKARRERFTALCDAKDRSNGLETMTTVRARSILTATKPSMDGTIANLNKSMTRHALWEILWNASQAEHGEIPHVTARNIAFEFGADYLAGVRR
jgi:hypothetical protein